MKAFAAFATTALVAIMLISCAPLSTVEEPMSMKPQEKPAANAGAYQTTTFAGGCFWCMEAAFEGVPGVIDVVSGYAGGTVKNPSYQQVISGTTGHRESIQLTYDPTMVSYKELLDLFWKQIDPTDDGGQFVDRGPQYRTAIFYHDEEQRRLAIDSKKALEESGKFDRPIVTEIVPFTNFYRAEEYHQDYAKKRALQYKLYEQASGRPEFKEEVWGGE